MSVRFIILPFLAFMTLPALAETESGETCTEANGDSTTIVMRLTKGPIVFLGYHGEVVLADCKSGSAVEVSAVDETDGSYWQSYVMDQLLKSDVAKKRVSFGDFEQAMRDQGYNTRKLILGDSRCACSDLQQE